jgi:hypothetical protein
LENSEIHENAILNNPKENSVKDYKEDLKNSAE